MSMCLHEWRWLACGLRFGADFAHAAVQCLIHERHDRFRRPTQYVCSAKDSNESALSISCFKHITVYFMNRAMQSRLRNYTGLLVTNVITDRAAVSPTCCV